MRIPENYGFNIQVADVPAPPVISIGNTDLICLFSISPLNFSILAGGSLLKRGIKRGILFQIIYIVLKIYLQMDLSFSSSWNKHQLSKETPHEIKGCHPLQEIIANSGKKQGKFRKELRGRDLFPGKSKINKMTEIVKIVVFLNKNTIYERFPSEVKGFIFRTNRSFFTLISQTLSSTV